MGGICRSSACKSGRIRATLLPECTQKCALPGRTRGMDGYILIKTNDLNSSLV